MPTAPENIATRYTRLPGRGRRLSARFVSGEAQRLYLGDDHLLTLRRIGYEETSKRFFLNDIQAITVQSNADRTIVSAALLLLLMSFAALFALSPAVEADPADIGMWILYAFLGFFGILLIANLALGPSCTVRLHTAVQIEDLTALRRLRAARKCLAILVPRIEAAQGVWPEGAATPQGLVERSARASASAKIIREKKPSKVIGRRVHAVAFALTVAFGASCLVELLFRSTAKDFADSALLAASMIALLTAAIRQVNSTLPQQARVLTWTIFVTNSITFFSAMYLAAFVTAFNAAQAGDPPPMMLDMTAAFGQRPPWFDVFVAVWGGLSVVLGVFGLLSIRGYTLVERGALEGQGAAPL